MVIKLHKAWLVHFYSWLFSFLKLTVVSLSSVEWDCLLIQDTQLWVEYVFTYFILYGFSSTTGNCMRSICGKVFCFLESGYAAMGLEKLKFYFSFFYCNNIPNSTSFSGCFNFTRICCCSGSTCSGKDKCSCDLSSYLKEKY